MKSKRRPSTCAYTRTIDACRRPGGRSYFASLWEILDLVIVLSTITVFGVETSQQLGVSWAEGRRENRRLEVCERQSVTSPVRGMYNSLVFSALVALVIDMVCRYLCFVQINLERVIFGRTKESS